MKRYLFPLTVLVAMAGCAQLPRIYQDPGVASSPVLSDCLELFPNGRWQLYHAIEATVPGGHKRTLTGVSVLSSRDSSIQWALMTVEGFILFSGRYNGALTVERAVAPFDRPGFAQGLVDDLLVLFFAPRAPVIAVGRMQDGGRVCRFGSPETTTDLVIQDDGTFSVQQYNSQKRLIRTVLADAIGSVANRSFARHLVLKNHGLIGYQLDLTLLEAIPLK